MEAFKSLNKNKRELKRRQASTYHALDAYKVKSNEKDSKLEKFEEKHGLSGRATSFIRQYGDHYEVSSYPNTYLTQAAQENSERTIKKAVDKKYDKQVFNREKRRQKAKVLEQEMLKYGETAQTRSVTNKTYNPDSQFKSRVKAVAYKNHKNREGTTLSREGYLRAQPYLDPVHGAGRMDQERNRRSVVGTKRGRPPPNVPWAPAPNVPPLNIQPPPGNTTKRVQKKARIARRDIEEGYSKMPPPTKTTRE